MIDGDVNEFVDGLYYGDEMYFIFRGRKYFIQGWVEGSLHYLVLDYDYETEPFDPKKSEGNKYKYIWEYSSTDSNECVQAFLNAPLWDGKKFYDVESEITWADPWP